MNMLLGIGMLRDLWRNQMYRSNVERTLSRAAKSPSSGSSTSQAMKLCTSDLQMLVLSDSREVQLHVIDIDHWIAAIINIQGPVLRTQILYLISSSTTNRSLLSFLQSDHLFLTQEPQLQRGKLDKNLSCGVFTAIFKLTSYCIPGSHRQPPFLAVDGAF